MYGLGVAAVVLAAGAGVRFTGDRHKLLCEVGGVPLVRRAVDAALAADLDETIVVMGAVDLLEVLPEEVTVLHNEAWGAGPGHIVDRGGELCGSRGHRAVVFGCGDQPACRPRPGPRWRRPTATSRWPTSAALAVHRSGSAPRCGATCPHRRRGRAGADAPQTGAGASDTLRGEP